MCSLNSPSIFKTGSSPNPVALVAYMRDQKGISFDLMEEQTAASFLESKNFYFKVKAFAKNYEKYHKPPRNEMYINLDFGHLIELSRLDKELRSLVLSLTLDIEHYLKVRINASAMRCGADRYELAERYQKAVRLRTYERQAENMKNLDAGKLLDRIARIAESARESETETLPTVVNDISELIDQLTGGMRPNHIREGIERMRASPYSMGLVKKYEDSPLPYWVLLELMTFGDTVSFYRACFSPKSKALLNDLEEIRLCMNIKPYLQCAVTLRNAAAHGDCLLNGLSDHHAHLRQKNKVRASLCETYGMDPDIVANESSVRIAIDLASILICYDTLVPRGPSSKAAAELVRNVSSRFRLHRDWFAKNSHIDEFFTFLDELLSVFHGRLASD